MTSAYLNMIKSATGGRFRHLFKPGLRIPIVCEVGVGLRRFGQS